MSDSQLDPSCSNFDPLQALHNSQFQLHPDGKVFDNVEVCVAHLEGRVKTKPTNKTNKVNVEEEERLERQFLPEQMPVAGKRKEFRHVVRRMGEFSSGPMSRLRHWMEGRHKVTVRTRGIDNIRGVATGFIVAFDKHWNLALADVDEQFTRKLSRKIPVGSSGTKQCNKPVQKEFHMGSSLVRIVERKEKSELCHRHVSQALLRGEHVVSVAVSAND